MTKEQLIELIDKKIPDGSLVDLQIDAEHTMEIFGIEDDCSVGLWHILARPIDGIANPYVEAIKNAYMWKDSLSADISKWIE